MSSSPFEFVNLFVQPPGDLIYFLIVIAVIQAAFFIAVGHRLRRPGDRATRRYVLATGGVVVAWVFLMVGAMVALVSGQNANAILPPLERAANVATLLLVGWAFLTADHDRWGRAPNFLLLILMAVVIGGYMITGIEWPALMAQVGFNESQYGVAWAAIPAALSIVGVVLILATFRLISDAPLKILYFAVLLAGYSLTINAMMQGTATGNYSGPSRLAFLAALPILLTVLYRHVIGQLEEQAAAASASVVAQPPAPSRPAPVTGPLPPLTVEPRAVSTVQEIVAVAGERESVQLIRALGLILEGATSTNIPERIVSATLQYLQADVGVLLVPQDANYSNILYGFDRVRDRVISGLSINLDAQPTLVNAIERRAQRPLYPDRNADELRDLYTRFDIDQTGPTYLQPLVSGKELLAVLVIGLPYASRELPEFSLELLRGIGIIAANLLGISFAAEEARAMAEERVIQAMTQGVPPEDVSDESVMAAWQEMKFSLEAARDQIMQLTRQVTMLKVELDYERSRVADGLSDTDEGQSISQRMLLLSEEHERLRDERERLASRLREAETALAGMTTSDSEGMFKTMIDLLNRERDDLTRQRDNLETQLVELRAGQGAPLTDVVEDMMERMAQERAQLEAERNELGSRVLDLESQLQALGLDAGTAALAQLIEQLYAQRAALESRNQQLQRERDALLNERARLDEQIQNEMLRDRQLQTLQQELQHVAEDREAILKQHDMLRAERDELAAKLDALKEQRARLTAEAAGFELELEEARAAQEDLRQHLQEIAAQRSELKAERDRLLAIQQALGIERDQAIAQVDGDRDRLAEIGQQGISSLTQLVEDISVQRDTLERELLETRNQLASLQERFDSLESGDTTEPQTRLALENPEAVVGMVQELRTPMTSIVGYVDLLLNESAGILGEMQRKFLQRVNANVNRLAAMLDDLTKMTMLDTGQFLLTPEPVDVVGVIEDAITNAGSQFREKDLTIRLDLDDDAPPLKADPDAIHQIVGQLLSNAYLVSPPGSDISVSARREPVRIGHNGRGRVVDSLVVSIADHGGGIAAEDQMRVFSRKYKAENPLIQGLGDTGVGLSIARALVEAHGGKIWLETNDQVGSTFNFALPLGAVSEPQG